jgi:hypothetical protein
MRWFLGKFTGVWICPIIECNLSSARNGDCELDANDGHGLRQCLLNGDWNAGVRFCVGVYPGNSDRHRAVL